MSKTYVLNDKQRKIVEKNLKVVPYFLRRLPCKNTEYEDLLSVGNIGLIKATATYDASANNTFGTYAKKCIENEFYMAKRKTKNRSKEISLESIVTCKEEGDDKISLKDIVLVDPTDITKGIEERDSLERTLELLLNMSSLKLKEKQVVFYRLGGMKQTEIGKQVDLSQASISRVIKSAFSKVKNFIDQNPDYTKEIRVRVTPTKYYLNIMLEDEAKCRLAYQILTEQRTYTDNIPDYMVSIGGSSITVSTYAEEEAYITIADILPKIEPYKQKKTKRRDVYKKDKENAKVYEFMMSQDVLVVKEVTAKFANIRYVDVFAFLRYEVRHGAITRIGRGKYRVNK